MGRRSTRTLLMGICLALAVAGAALAKSEPPIVVIVGNLKITANASFSPKTLPRHEFTPITLKLNAKLETLNGAHPPALREFVLEADKNSAVNAKGLPVCTAGKLQATDTRHAELACPQAIVGEGETAVEVEFPESNPFIATSKLLVFNGGVKGDTTTVLVHAYLSSPVSAAIVTTVKVSKVHNGRYGIRAVSTIPKIAGGYGSPISFSLEVGRSFTYRGKKQGYLLAQCPDGHLAGKGIGVFADGSRLSGSAIRRCTPSG